MVFSLNGKSNEHSRRVQVDRAKEFANDDPDKSLGCLNIITASQNEQARVENDTL